MSTAVGVIVGVSVVIVLVVAAVSWLFWSTRVGPRSDEKPDEHYRRVRGGIHSPRNVRIARAKERRRKAWAAGSAGAVGMYSTDAGGDSGCSAAGFGAGGGGCSGGGGGCGGGGGGCGGGGS